MFSSSSPFSPLPSPPMEYGLGWHGRTHTSSAPSSSSQTPPPPPAILSPIVDPHQWMAPGGFLYGGGGGAVTERAALVGAAPVQTLPSRIPYETLESAFSGLALREHAGRSLYNLAGLGANVGPASWSQDPLLDALTLIERQSSDFDVSRSAFQQNLPDQDFYPYSAARNYAAPASSSDYNPIPGVYGGSRLLSGGLLSRRTPEPCRLADCSCQYNPSALDQYHYQRNMVRQKLSANTPLTTSNGTGNRRNSRPRLDLDPISINLMNLKGRVVDWAKDQNGCRVLQSKFQDPKTEEIEMVLSEVLDHVPELMIHSFGNYFIQKLIDVSTEEQRSRLLASVIFDRRQLIYICFDNHGTRAVQKLLEKLTSPYQIHRFMVALAPGVVDLIKDINGHHVIQHCLKNFSAQQNEFLLHEVARNCFDIATDKSGCCVLQQCVDNSEGEIRESLLFNIISNALQLAEDPYGNYVVQHVLELNDHQLGARIIEQLLGSFIQLSCNKFASHVVEKCLTKTDINQASVVIYELLKSLKISELLVDQYGNFVFQAALSSSLSSSQVALYENLRRVVQSNISSMRNNMYGRKILGWFERNGQPVV
ncbi:hypothetical protein V2J09_023849 [Rumex salicifolius]